MWQYVWPYKPLRLSHAQLSTTTTIHHRLHSPVKVNVVDITFHIICHISLVICNISSISSTSPPSPYEIPSLVLNFIIFPSTPYPSPSVTSTSLPSHPLPSLISTQHTFHFLPSVISPFFTHPPIMPRMQAREAEVQDFKSALTNTVAAFEKLELLRTPDAVETGCDEFHRSLMDLQHRFRSVEAVLKEKHSQRQRLRSKSIA